MNIASALKAEIARVARKEIRGELQALKKASACYRTELAALKRRAVEVERLLSRLSKGMRKSRPTDDSAGASAAVVRYSSKNLAAQRKRLALSAKDFGLLLGVSGASVYLWEKGSSRPRASQMQAIASVRKLGKSQAATKLEEMASASH